MTYIRHLKNHPSFKRPDEGFTFGSFETLPPILLKTYARHYHIFLENSKNILFFINLKTLIMTVRILMLIFEENSKSVRCGSAVKAALKTNLGNSC